MNRRAFLRTAAGGAALLGFRRRAYADYRSPGLRLWQTAFRGVGPGGIPVAAPDGFLAPVTGAVHYTINIRQFADQLHPDSGRDNALGLRSAVALGTTNWNQRTWAGSSWLTREFRYSLQPETSFRPRRSCRWTPHSPGLAEGPNRAACTCTADSCRGSATEDRWPGLIRTAQRNEL